MDNAINKTKASLVSLPKEIFENVLGHLDVFSTVRLSETCKWLNIQCKSQKVWKTKCHRWRYWSSLRNNDHIAVLLAQDEKKSCVHGLSILDEFLYSDSLLNPYNDDSFTRPKDITFFGSLPKHTAELKYNENILCCLPNSPLTTTKRADTSAPMDDSYIYFREQYVSGLDCKKIPITDKKNKNESSSIPKFKYKVRVSDKNHANFLEKKNITKFSVDWPQVFKQRYLQDRFVNKTLDKLTVTKRHYLPTINSILDLDIEAKEVLLNNYAYINGTANSSLKIRYPQNYLTRSEIAKDLLGLIYRYNAVRILQSNEFNKLPLDTAMAVFGAFRNIDLNDIMFKLDILYLDFRERFLTHAFSYAAKEKITLTPFSVVRLLIRYLLHLANSEYYQCEHDFGMGDKWSSAEIFPFLNIIRNSAEAKIVKHIKSYMHWLIGAYTNSGSGDKNIAVAIIFVGVARRLGIKVRPFLILKICVMVDVYIDSPNKPIKDLTEFAYKRTSLNEIKFKKDPNTQRQSQNTESNEFNFKNYDKKNGSFSADEDYMDDNAEPALVFYPAAGSLISRKNVVAIVNPSIKDNNLVVNRLNSEFSVVCNTITLASIGSYTNPDLVRRAFPGKNRYVIYGAVLGIILFKWNSAATELKNLQSMMFNEEQFYIPPYEILLEKLFYNCPFPFPNHFGYITNFLYRPKIYTEERRGQFTKDLESTLKGYASRSIKVRISALQKNSQDDSNMSDKESKDKNSTGKNSGTSKNPAPKIFNTFSFSGKHPPGTIVIDTKNGGYGVLFGEYVKEIVKGYKITEQDIPYYDRYVEDDDEEEVSYVNNKDGFEDNAHLFLPQNIGGPGQEYCLYNRLLWKTEEYRGGYYSVLTYNGMMIYIREDNIRVARKVPIKEIQEIEQYDDFGMYFSRYNAEECRFELSDFVYTKVTPNLDGAKEKK